MSEATFFVIFASHLYYRIYIYMDKTIELSVENFKAVKKADISLDGITVVAGINGCGKSSLSQLLYYSFELSNRYDTLVDSFLRDSMRDYVDALKQIEREIKGENTVSVGPDFVSVKDKDGYLQYVNELTSRFIRYRDFIIELGEKDKLNSYNRIIKIIQDVLYTSSNDLELLLKQLIVHIKDSFDNAIQLQEERHYSLLGIILRFHLKQELPEHWNIREYGVPFAGAETTTVPILHYIKRVAYIDTPMMLGIPIIESKKYWADLTHLLNKTLVSGGENQPLYASLSQIMNGESVVEEDGIRDRKLSYRRNDGKVFDLNDCATGIKAFSILQLLLKNGFLQKDTLLIIDEPEAHLHPQWIVEYARMIVMLHKQIGVKFFIASHSTDMVSAIRYIAAKEEVQGNLNFYLAEDSRETPYEYTYRELGLDIDPIFKSFNKSFDKIDEYGSYE